jgi:YegS/Rv2252/BmrU family lipid kinase
MSQARAARPLTMPLAVIVNPAAAGGRAGRALPRLADALRARGLRHRIACAADLQHARRLALDAAARDEIPVAFGGDGLVGALAGALRCSGARLGIIPAGRGNDLARVLGIPTGLAAAVEVLATGRVRTIDLGVASPCGRAGPLPDEQPRAFVGIASAGIDSEVNRIANSSRMPLGRAIYAYALLRALPSWRPARFALSLDGGAVVQHTGYSVAAANSSTFGGGMRLAPQAQIDDGMLDVVLISHLPRLRYLRLAPTVMRGTHVRLPIVEVLRCRALKLSADLPFALYADGEQLCRLPATISVLPSALGVLCPGGS